MDSVIEYVILGVDAVLVPIIYYCYKSASKKLFQIEKAPEISFDSKQGLPTSIEYGVIKGFVEPKNRQLESNYKTGCKGVVRVYEVNEHVETWRDGSLFGARKILRNVTRDIDKEAFYLLDTRKKPYTQIEISDVTQADYIMNELETTHKIYEPVNQPFFSALLKSALAKEVTTGIETSESMLKTGTFLYGYGSLKKLDDHKYLFIKPSSSYMPFIITKKDRLEIANSLKSSVSTFRFLLIIFGSIGLGLGIYVGYKHYKKFCADRLQRKMLDDLRRERLRLQKERMQNYGTENSSLNNSLSEGSQQLCVVCISNPREVVLLDCGHVCLCLDCVEHINNRLCPVCRQQFHSFARCFIP